MLENLIKQYEEKYKNVDLKDFSSYYYGSGNVMDKVLNKMQEGIDKAAEIYAPIKENGSEMNVIVDIDEDNYKMVFSYAEYDEEIYGPSEDSTKFYEFLVGEPMVEALFVMKKMDESNFSTGLSQAINNWVEDLNFDSLGEFTEDVQVSDTWSFIEY